MKISRKLTKHAKTTKKSIWHWPTTGHRWTVHSKYIFFSTRRAKTDGERDGRRTREGGDAYDFFFLRGGDADSFLFFFLSGSFDPRSFFLDARSFSLALCSAFSFRSSRSRSRLISARRDSKSETEAEGDARRLEESRLSVLESRQTYETRTISPSKRTRQAGRRRDRGDQRQARSQ